MHKFCVVEATSTVFTHDSAFIVVDETERDECIERLQFGGWQADCVLEVECDVPLEKNLRDVCAYRFAAIDREKKERRRPIGLMDWNELGQAAPYTPIRPLSLPDDCPEAVLVFFARFEEEARACERKKVAA